MYLPKQRAPKPTVSSTKIEPGFSFFFFCFFFKKTFAKLGLPVDRTGMITCQAAVSRIQESLGMTEVSTLTLLINVPIHTASLYYLGGL